MRWGAWLVAVVLAWAVPARAENDYAVDSTAWNGLHELAALAAGSGLSVEARTSLPWAELGPADVLFVLYPTSRVDPVHLAAFLRAGGRVLLADDFGKADEALARLGLLRHRGPLGPVRVHDGNPGLPIAVPLEEGHALARGVGELVTNHPSAFTVESGPEAVFGYRRDEAVVVAGSLGAGRFVALSDPSVLINDMLAFDGNLAFAANLLDFLAPARPGRVLVLTGDALLTGAPKGVDDRGGSTLNELCAELATFLDELNDYLAPAPVLRALAVLGGLGVLLVAAVILPLRGGRDLDGGFARVAAEPASLERLVAEYDDAAPDRNFAFPAAVLRENVEPELEQRLGGLPGDARGPTLRALELVRELPPRAAVLTMAAHVSRKTFLQAHDAATGAMTDRRPTSR